MNTIQNPDYDSLKLELTKNRLKRRHHQAKGKLIEIERGNKALVERIAKHYSKKSNPEFQNEQYSSISRMQSLQNSKILANFVQKEKIAEENSRILEKLLFPVRKSSMSPSLQQQAKDHERAVECKERLQKSKQSWKTNFKHIWDRVEKVKLSLPSISTRQKSTQIFPFKTSDKRKSGVSQSMKYDEEEVVKKLELEKKTVDDEEIAEGIDQDNEYKDDFEKQ